MRVRSSQRPSQKENARGRNAFRTGAKEPAPPFEADGRRLRKACDQSDRRLRVLMFGEIDARNAAPMYRPTTSRAINKGLIV